MEISGGGGRGGEGAAVHEIISFLFGLILSSTALRDMYACSHAQIHF